VYDEASKGGRKAMDIIEAISQRRSIRAFKPDLVPQEILGEIIELSLRAPSWGNTQPWEFATVSGRELEEIRIGFIEKAGEEPTPDIKHPQQFPEPYDTRLRAIVATLHGIMGIRREDREGRARWQLQQSRHFEAPCVIYIYIDRSFYFQPDGLNVLPIFDCGLVAENIMLLATNYGLGTVPQAEAVILPDVVRKVLRIPDSKLIVIGIAIGYPNWPNPISQFRSEREPLDKVAKWYGFD